MHQIYLVLTNKNDLVISFNHFFFKKIVWNSYIYWKTWRFHGYILFLLEYFCLPNGRFRYRAVQKHTKTSIEAEKATSINRLFDAVDRTIIFSNGAAFTRALIELKLSFHELGRICDRDFNATRNTTFFSSSIGHYKFYHFQIVKLLLLVV